MNLKYCDIHPFLATKVSAGKVLSWKNKIEQEIPCTLLTILSENTYWNHRLPCRLCEARGIGKDAGFHC